LPKLAPLPLGNENNGYQFKSGFRLRCQNNHRERLTVSTIKLFFLALAVCFVSCLPGSNIYGQAERIVKIDESKELPLRLTVEVNGKKIAAVENTEFVLSGEYKDAKVVVKTADSRDFKYAGLSFEYPTNYSWTADVANEDYKIWTMSGDMGVINVYEVDEEFNSDEYIQQVVEELDNDDYDQVDFTMEMGGVEYKGQRFTFKYLDVPYTRDIFELPLRNGKARMLILEDFLPEENPDYPHLKKAYDLMVKTFKVD